MFSPFSGWLFNRARVADPGRATSPPYDAISLPEREGLLSRSPYNIVRALLPGLDPESYRRAGALLDEWGGTGVLVRDDGPRFYLYEIDYVADGGEARTVRGVLGALEVGPFGRVVPHEETIRIHDEDRAAVLEATRANLDPIMALSVAPELPGLLEHRDEARLNFTEEDGSVHRIYDVTEPSVVEAVVAAVARYKVSIADGHHRYTTAQRYRSHRSSVDGRGPWDAIMAMVSPAEGSGLSIGPYHRVLSTRSVDIERAREAFEVTTTKAGPPSEPGTIVSFNGASAHHLRPRSGTLATMPAPLRSSSTAVAEALLYPLLGVDETGARYTADTREAIDLAAEPGSVAILAAPLTEHAIATAGEAGLRFPTKSTYFVPKPRAGVVMRSLVD